MKFEYTRKTVTEVERLYVQPPVDVVLPWAEHRDGCEWRVISFEIRRTGETRDGAVQWQRSTTRVNALRLLDGRTQGGTTPLEWQGDLDLSPARERA